MKRVLGNILCDFDPKVKVNGYKVCIRHGVPPTAALVFLHIILLLNTCKTLSLTIYSVTFV